MNGALGRSVNGFDLDRRDAERRPRARRVGERGGARLVEERDVGVRRRAARSSASKSRPDREAFAVERDERAPGTRRRARRTCPRGPSRSRRRNAMRARSRSTTSRVATLCTRPAERARPDAAAQRRSRPRSRRAGRGCGGPPAPRPASCRGRASSRSPSSIASLVISWNTMRLTGTRRLQHLEEVPRDRLALAVLVGREVELARRPSARPSVPDRRASSRRAPRRSGAKWSSTSMPRRRPRLGDALGRLLGAAGRSRMWPSLAITVYRSRRGSPRWSWPSPATRRSRVAWPRAFLRVLGLGAGWSEPSSRSAGPRSGRAYRRRTVVRRRGPVNSAAFAGSAGVGGSILRVVHLLRRSSSSASIPRRSSTPEPLR